MATHHDRRDKRGWFLEKYDPLQAGSIDGADSEPHDHAIKRAMNATYKKPSNADGVDTDPERTVFIGHLNAMVTSDDLKSCLSHYGAIESASVVRNKVTGISQRYGFVTFQDMSSALSLFHASRRHTISITYTSRNLGKPEAADRSATQAPTPILTDDVADNLGSATRPNSYPTVAPAKTSQPVLVDFERSRVMEGWIPRRLGGGLGGKKESGQLRFGGGLKPFRTPFGAAPSSISPYLQDELCWHPVSRSKQEENQSGNNKNQAEKGDRERGKDRVISRSRSPTRDRQPGRYSTTPARGQDRDRDSRYKRPYSRSPSRERRDDRYSSSSRAKRSSDARDRDRLYSRSDSRDRRSDRYSKGGDYRDHRDRRDYRD
ncbi:MAG: hypothetical protein BYD32DRAFT_465521 [Podila humilis]|nr:MAG: hypothetical protein BYD32DRAFT_465521 [Podila humilis]